MQLPLYEDELEAVLPLFLLAWRVDQNTVKVRPWVDLPCCLPFLVAELVLDQFQYVKIENIVPFMLSVSHDGGVLTNFLPQIPLEYTCRFTYLGFLGHWGW